jgi:hypothetical protein
MLLFFKKLIYFLVNYLCLLPNFIFFYRKTLNNNQKINKKNLREKGFFLLNNELLKNEKEFILSIINKLDINAIINNQDTNTDLKGASKYVIDLLKSNHLSFNEKYQIKNSILKNKKLTDEISATLGFKSFPISLNLMINHFNKDNIEFEGPKQWHRDNSAAAGQVKVFFILNKINKDTGGHFYYLPLSAVEPYKKFFLKKDYNNRIRLWNRYRYRDDEIKKFKDFKDDIKVYPSNNDDLADILVINTNDCYHKGGYIKKEGCYRLLLHIVFDPALSFTDQGGNTFLKRIFTYSKNTFREKISLE